MAESELYGGKASDPSDADSLANYLDVAFNDVRAEFGLDPLPEEGRDERMLIFLAIARGVVRYLADHEQAFVVSSDDGPAHTHSGHVQIAAET